jgi:hypothetical protein
MSACPRVEQIDKGERATLGSWFLPGNHHARGSSRASGGRIDPWLEKQIQRNVWARH